MATRFLRLDLSPNARDFFPIAAEPGLPLLDKSNANYRVVRRWLGRFVAEPEWHGDVVELFVCDDEQARLNNVRCEPATADDLRRNRELSQEFKDLSARLEKIQPGPREVKLHEAVVDHFRRLTLEAGPVHAECHLFKYRDGNSWRLVWGWGYQRQNLAPATATICTNPGCSLLFVRYADGSRDCPGCEAQAMAVTAAPGRRRSRLPVLLGLLLVAAAAGVAGYLFAIKS